jgi:hypothetical protein
LRFVAEEGNPPPKPPLPTAKSPCGKLSKRKTYNRRGKRSKNGWKQSTGRKVKGKPTGAIADAEVLETLKP